MRATGHGRGECSLKCRQAKNLLSPYMDGELHGKQKAALEEHLASCEACREELEFLRTISETIRDIFRRIEPPPDLLERTMRRIREMEATGEIERLRREESRRMKVRKTVMGVGLAAGIGLAALQIGRAGIGPATQPGGPVAPAPRVAVTADGTKAAPEGEPQVAVKPQEDTSGKTVAAKVAPAAPEVEAARSEAAKAATRVAAAPDTGASAKGTGAVTAPEQPGKPAEEAQVASAAGAAGPEQRVFLSGSRHVRTTMVKLEVADLEAARAAVAAAAIEARAREVREAWSYQQKEAILRVVLPVGAAGQFLADVAALGSEVERKTETADVTVEYNRGLAEYQELSVKADPQSQALARAAAQILESYERESLEAGREVVNVWLKLR